ncbi:MAG: molybdopterin-synthase adenylyltransferase MoeB [Candidatus Omnitrophica bacterium]|nr:molybdopterin-synthase adenylyltransferase MoeB [Candidatus Omnitrophota bacterium]MCM8802610.1 molybdopterin-synthase adenylyltransferase MoeB [Candidatus Omnitrophota bacterium]
MGIKVRIPTPLQKLTNNQSEVECEGKNIKELIENLDKKYPGIKERICDENGNLRRFINFFVNDKDIRFLEGDNTELKDGDEVSIIPAIAGGTDFREDQIERYSRQIILPEIGGAGQKKLLNAKVLIIGCGGLGSPCAYYLAAAGIGKIGLVDSDKVELNNLQRQIIHFMQDIGKQKTESAKEKLNAINPDVEIVTYPLRITSQNIMEIIKEYDIVIDGSDNFPTRYLVNDACVMSNKPLSHAGILRFDGQATTIIPHQSPCYRCIFPEPPPPGVIPSCQEAGILGVVAGILGLIQATEVLKFILGKGELLIGKLLVFNALEMSFRKLNIHRNNNCAVCGDKPTITELIDYEQFCELRSSD